MSMEKKTAGKTEKQRAVHTFGPVYEEESRILILGSFPSVKSREKQFYYGHPRNRFWQVISVLYQKPYPESIPEKRRLLFDCHIALWDVIYSCDIRGSSDSSIENVTANPITELLEKTSVQKVYCNGQTAFRLYRKYCEPQTGKAAILLPSTSPANAAWTLERLLEAWQVINGY